jgi:N-methylhydantoinase B
MTLAETRTPLAADLYDEAAYQTPEYEPFRTMHFPRSEEDIQKIAAAKRSLDPITLDVLEGALEAAIAEAEAAVERSARSTIIREQHDYRAAINTVQCDSVTHVSFGATADPIRAQFPLEDMHPGDIFIYNDVFAAHGTIQHLPDYCVVMPLFAEGQVRGFAQIYGHTQDVGGSVVGSWPVTSKSIFEEGVQVPPVRIWSRGVRCNDVYKIILRNTRFPDELAGDIDAFVGACRIIARRFEDICARLGADIVEAGMYKLIDRCGEALRAVALPKFPNGEWSTEDFVDSDGITLDQPVKVALKLMKDPEKIILDWSGTAGQVEGPINFASTGRFIVKWLGGFLKQFARGVTVNEGVCQVMRSYCPPDTVMTPKLPAAVANRSQTNLRNTSAFSAALAQAMGGEIVADSNTLQIYGYYGKRDDGSDFILREVFGAGSGARPYADGTDAVDMVPNARNLPSEFVEQTFPVIVERTALFTNSGGPGKYRGGLGYTKDIRVLRDGFVLTCCDRTVFGCWGVKGGKAGTPGGTFINPGTPDEVEARFSRDGIPVKAGDIVRVTTPGGGGYGDPLEREIGAVLLDVKRGLVTMESASEDYGVVVSKSKAGRVTTFHVDDKATKVLRASKRKNRTPLLLIERGDYANRMRGQGKIAFSDIELKNA